MIRSNDNAWRILDIVLAFLVAISSATAGWGAKAVIDLQNRVTAIEASRFTAAMGLEVWQEIAAVKQSLAALPREVPPKWFIDRVDALDRKLESIDDRLQQIERNK